MTSPAEHRQGSFLVGGPVGEFPWQRWSHATRVADQQRGLLLAIPRSRLTPGLQRSLETHLRAPGAGLQPLQVEQAGEQILIFSALPAGQLLAERLNGKTLSPRATCQLGIALAHSLQKLHECGVVHAAPRIDRVWLADSGQVVLLRDPAVDPEQQGRAGPDDWLQSSEPAAHDAAPEFSVASCPADPATDIYGLGCLLFRVLRGHPLVEATEWHEAVCQHAQVRHPALVQAIEQGSEGDPLLRVIAHATAKQRGARFRSAGELAEALAAILPSVGQPSAPQIVAPPPAEPATEPATEPAAEPAAVVPVLDASPRQRSSAGTGARRRRATRQRTWWVIGLGTAVVLATAAIAMRSIRREPTASSAPSTTAPPVASRPSAARTRAAIEQPESVPVPEEPRSGYQLVDDERLLFAPPYPPAANPLSLALLPPGPGMIVSLRPEVLLNPDEPLVEALAPESTKLIDSLARRIGMSVDSIRRVTAAIHPGEVSGVEISLAIELSQPRTLEDLTKLLELTPSRTARGDTLYTGEGADQDVCFFPATRDAEALVAQFAIGSLPRMTEVAELEGNAILLPRNLQSLWDQAHRETDLVVLLTPNFLLADARTLLQQTIPAAIEPLKSVLIPDVSGMLVVIAFDERQAFAEIRCLPAGGLNEARLMRQLSEAVSRWPQWADQFVMTAEPEPSWRLLATRLPLMARFASDRVRFGMAEGAAIANLYLPRDVVPQLALASALALNTPTGTTVIASSPPARSLTLAEMLDREVSVSFDQESLESALQTVIAQFQQTLPEGSESPPVRILGADLQKMGITQNQQIRNFARSQTPLRTVLTALCLEANPDRTAEGATDPKQALVWVIGEDPDGSGKSVILITTRQAAAGRYELPGEFRGPQ